MYRQKGGMAIEFHVFDTKNQALEQASKKLSHILEQELQNQNAILLLLSGGSALEILENINLQTFDGDITVAPLDERYSKDPAENNMAQIIASGFYRNYSELLKIIDTRVQEGELQQQLATRFNDGLVEWKATHPTGKIIATVGMGPDGHVSGMMPFPENSEFFESRFNSTNELELVKAYDASGKNPYTLRVTTTVNLMRKIDIAIVFIVGENKREALQRVKNQTGELAEIPALVFYEMPEVHVFTDIN